MLALKLAQGFSLVSCSFEWVKRTSYIKLRNNSYYLDLRIMENHELGLPEQG